jgi:ribosomal protein S18 acetylase RimI-like enzyme
MIIQRTFYWKRIKVMEADKFIITSPRSPEEFKLYYDLRWRKLRKPWDQPEGSEKDKLEDTAYHVMVCVQDRIPIGIGRLHLNSPDEAQIRFMAVEVEYQKKGIGSMIIKELERLASSAGAKYIVLNSRDTAIPFYEKHGYNNIKQTLTLFGSIPHHIMRKNLT